MNSRYIVNTIVNIYCTLLSTHCLKPCNIVVREYQFVLCIIGNFKESDDKYEFKPHFVIYICEDTSFYNCSNVLILIVVEMVLIVKLLVRVLTYLQ